MKKAKTYTLAQITTVVSFAIAFLSAVVQIIAIFLPDQTWSRWTNAIAMLVAIIGVIVGIVASRYATREQLEQFEAEKKAREEGLFEQKWYTRMLVGLAVGGIVIMTGSYIIGLFRAGLWFSKRMAEDEIKKHIDLK